MTRAALVLALCVSACAPPEPDLVDLNSLGGTITFASERDGPRAVYQIAPGAEPVRLTLPGLDEVPLAVSPDGRGVVVGRAAETPDGPAEQLVLYRDGRVEAELTDPRRRARNPVWGPRGVVFESDRDGFSDLYRAGDGGRERLTDDPAGAFEPSVRRRDGALAFVSSRDGQAEIYVAASDGRDAVRVPGSPRDDWAPRWSPDGERLVLLSDDRGRDELYLVRPDGTGRIRLGESRASDEEMLEAEASWSPDGTSIVYTTTRRSGTRQVWRVDLEDLTHIALTDTTSHSHSPVWSPEGQHLAFVSDRSGDDDIHVMRADGAGAVRLTVATGRDNRPFWSRAPR